MDVTMLANAAGHWVGPWFLLFPLFWLFVIGVALFAWRGRRERWHVGSAESVLAERFAKGEITDDEYRQRLRVLRGKGG